MMWLFTEQDGGLVVFRDIRPAATHHYLVCPKEHIRDAKHLDYTHLPLGKDFLHMHKDTLVNLGVSGGRVA